MTSKLKQEIAKICEAETWAVFQRESARLVLKVVCWSVLGAFVITLGFLQIIGERLQKQIEDVKELKAYDPEGYERAVEAVKKRLEADAEASEGQGQFFELTSSVS